MPKKSETYYSMWEGYDLERERVTMCKSQAAFASMLGMSHRMYCYYERNEKKIPKSVEYAVRYIVRRAGDDQPVGKAKGTLTDFQRTRIEVLSDAASKACNDEQNPSTKKILQQSSEELDFLLSKFDK